MTLDDLRKIAEAATKGPWEVRKNNRPGPGPDFVEAPNDPYLVVPVCEIPSPAPNAEFIAAFNPQKVLELLDQIEQLQAVVRDSHDECTYQTRLAAVEKIADAIEEHDAPFEAFSAAQWIRKAARGE